MIVYSLLISRLIKPLSLGLLLLIVSPLLTFTGLSASQNIVQDVSHPSLTSLIETIQEVKACIDQHPEILWLADSNVRNTEEGFSSLQGTYSEQLFGKKYIEFDRTMMTIRCLKLILNGSEKAYGSFTSAQPKDLKLSPESFHALHMHGQNLLCSQWQGMSKFEMAQAMETALVLGDIGKSEKARELFKPYGCLAPDHDDFHGEAMQVIKKHPHLSPSFATLSPAAKELLVKSANLAHYGHITHLEGGIGMFSTLKETAIPSLDPVALSFDLFVHTCDVAGALGHLNNQSSLMYIEETYQAIKATQDAINILSDPSKTEYDAYNAYLKTRAAWLGLNAENTLDRVLARIGAMLRLFTHQDGASLRKGMLELSPNAQEKILAQLDIQQKKQPSRTPTYMPAVLINLSNNPQLGKTKEDRLTQAITLGLPFIAKVLEKHQELLADQEIDPAIPLNFNKMAGIAKQAPHRLSEEFTIDLEGNIHLKQE